MGSCTTDTRRAAITGKRLVVMRVKGGSHNVQEGHTDSHFNSAEAARGDSAGTHTVLVLGGLLLVPSFQTSLHQQRPERH